MANQDLVITFGSITMANQDLVIAFGSITIANSMEIDEQFQNIQFSDIGDITLSTT